MISKLYKNNTNLTNLNWGGVTEYFSMYLGGTVVYNNPKLLAISLLIEYNTQTRYAFENKIIFVNEESFTTDSSGKVYFEIPYGAKYEIIYPSITGYYDIPKETYTAEESKTTITKQYSLKQGVYICDNNNILYDTDEQLIGTFKGIFCYQESPYLDFILTTQKHSGKKWALTQELVSNVFTTIDAQELTNERGSSSTVGLVAKYGITDDYAAGYCRLYGGYLPGIKELQYIATNRKKINEMFTKMNIIPLAADLYWSSTQKDENEAWEVSMLASGDYYRYTTYPKSKDAFHAVLILNTSSF